MPFIGTAATPCFPFHLPEQESAGRGPCEMPAESRGLSRRPPFRCRESAPARLHRTARYRRRKMRCLALPVPICQSALFLIVFHAARTCGCRGRSAHAVPDAVRSRCRHVCSGGRGSTRPGQAAGARQRLSISARASRPAVCRRGAVRPLGVSPGRQRRAAPSGAGVTRFAAPPKTILGRQLPGRRMRLSRRRVAVRAQERCASAR